MKSFKIFTCAVVMAAMMGLTSGAGAADTGTGVDLMRQLNQAFVDVAAKVSPSVVVITVVQKATEEDFDNDTSALDSLPPSLRRFHEGLRRAPEKTLGKGSGIIIRPDGYILTNGHVVEDAESIDVRLQDGRVLKGAVRGTDSASDLAVIKVAATNLPAAKLADSNQVRVGEFAIAIGAPFSLDYTVTFGHISAKGRSQIIEGLAGAAMDQDFLQTDALINPGNSGGPLVNVDGEVIGINTLIEGLHTGIGFAIPSTLAREVSDELIAQGKFTRAWLGIAIQALHDQPELLDVLKGVKDGVVVAGIMQDGPAAKSDLRPTDVITAVDGSQVSTPQELRNAIRRKKIGQPISLDVVRSGKLTKVKVSPGEREEPAVQVTKVKQTTTAPSLDPAKLGVTVQELTKDLATQFGVHVSEGVVVASVDKNSPAGRHGLQAGDIITSVNQQVTASPKEFKEAIKKADLNKGVLVNLLSRNQARFEILKAP